MKHFLGCAYDLYSQSYSPLYPLDFIRHFLAMA